MMIPVSLGEHSYDIVLEPGALNRADDLLELERKVLIVTDTGVPAVYAEAVAAACREPLLYRVPQGEGSKSLQTFGDLLSAMLQAGFTRDDCVVAVGGGVVGDLAGFAAACYMRGLDFYNIPTTVLSQVDSSVGGKTAVNLGGIKNVVGAFYQPRRVLIDPAVLSTLPRRQTANGLAEAVKMALTSDAALFELFEQGSAAERLPEIIERSVRIKKAVVEQDEKEQGLRRILNFGHTIGHGLESQGAGLYHGECVAMGMLPMCGPAVRQRLLPVLTGLGLPTCCLLDREQVYAAVLHDKKAAAGRLKVVKVDEVGSCRMENVAPETLKPLIAEVTKG
ncbi:MAG: 3-dehydroquinate synthase [Firmicutes bacterium]|nr:3-dehydroquinate synthase [Bacillota bacterium]